MRRGLLAEFETPEKMLAAIEELRRRGYRRLDAYTPYPVHGAEKALGFRRSPINWLAFPLAVAGTAFGYILQWWCNAVDYPLDVGGRPPHAAPAFIPITFETMVLVTSLVGFLIFTVLSNLPQLWSPEFDVPGFERASIDRFWIGVDARDPALIPTITARDLTDVGALQVAWAGGGRR